jgi:hypothetical protein
MPIGWFYGPDLEIPPKVGHPKRDRRKIKAGRKSARHGR